MAKTTHFCLGHAVKSEISYTPGHIDCGMEMDMDHEEDDSSQNPQSCCENITEHLQVDDEVQLKKQYFSIEPLFAQALVLVFVFGVELVEIDQPEYVLYTTPPLLQDYPVLYQSFLI